MAATSVTRAVCEGLTGSTTVRDGCRGVVDVVSGHDGGTTAGGDRLTRDDVTCHDITIWPTTVAQAHWT